MGKCRCQWIVGDRTQDSHGVVLKGDEAGQKEGMDPVLGYEKNETGKVGAGDEM